MHSRLGVGYADGPTTAATKSDPREAGVLAMKPNKVDMSRPAPANNTTRGRLGRHSTRGIAADRDCQRRAAAVAQTSTTSARAPAWRIKTVTIPRQREREREYEHSQ